MNVDRDKFLEAIQKLEAAGGAEAQTPSIADRIAKGREVSGIPARVLRAAIEPSETDATRAVGAGHDDLIVLAGAPGRGKSVAACVWLLGGGLKTRRWVTAGDLSRGYAYDRAAFRELATVDRLVIDDLGQEYQDEKGRYQSTLDELVAARFADERKTCITTNITDAAAFKTRYGDRLASRINESGRFETIGGEDIRRSKQIEKGESCPSQK